MYRNVVSKAIKSYGSRRYVTSTAALKPESSASKGLLSWLTGGISKTVALGSPLPGVTLPPVLPDYIEPSKTQITTLSNGFKIASEASSAPVASLGLYIDCGSIYETPSSVGVTQLLERMAFKTTTNRSYLRIVREVEAIGGNVTASASREQMGYTYDALKVYVPQMLEVLVDCVRNPVFQDYEVDEQIKKARADIAEINKNPQGLLLEVIHSTGYSGALANPLLAPESALSTMNAKLLEEFVAENYTASRMVLAATGVDHEEFLSIAEPLLSDLPVVARPVEPTSVYVGGDYRCQADSPSTHVVLAFEVPGGWHNEKEAYLLTVLQMLMGGGSSFSAGGPGKGMYSRLYRRVLNENEQMEQFTAFVSIYNNTGLFGIHASTGSDFVSQTVAIMARELIEIATPEKVTQKELDRAKVATKSAVLMSLESRMVAAEDIGRQVLTYGHRKPVEGFIKMVDEITLSDITNIAKKMISTPLTMASWGDVAHVPSYDSVKSKFHAK